MTRAQMDASASTRGQGFPLDLRLAHGPGSRDNVTGARRGHISALLESVDRCDVRMVQRREHFCFALKACQAIRIASDRGREIIGGNVRCRTVAYSAGRAVRHGNQATLIGAANPANLLGLEVEAKVERTAAHASRPAPSGRFISRASAGQRGVDRSAVAVTFRKKNTAG